MMAFRNGFCVLILIAFLALDVGIVGASAPAEVALLKQGSSREIRLVAQDPVADAEFGRSVAIDGDLVAVGAGGADAGSASAAGAVYLFKRQGQTLVPVAKLVAPDPTTGAEFGRIVAIEGNRVIVGARFAEAGDLAKAGAVYVFGKHGGSWQFEEKITSPTPADEDNFGRALAVQGNLLVVTARKENLGASDVGAAYVYRYKGGSWVYQEKLTASDPMAGAYFGQSVDVQGSVIAVGARNADPNGAGAVYLFRRSGNGWIEFAKVTPPDGASDDHFGFTIAMAGNTMTVGARRADLPGAKDAGAAYVYSISGDAVRLAAKLTASDATKGDQFGQSVAYAGEVIAVGAWKDENGLGSIYLFRRMGDTWTGTGRITASDGVAGDEFGYSLSAFGNRLATGAHFADSTSGVSNAGAAYVVTVKP